MLRIILVLLLALFPISAGAQSVGTTPAGTYINPPAAFIAQENAAGIPLTCVAGANPQDPHFKLTFSSAATPAQIAQANTDAATFNWTAAPTPGTNLFLQAVLGDATLDISHKAVALEIYNTTNPTTMQTIYTAAWTQFGAQDTQMTTIAGYVTTYNIPVTQK
jgi:hypothetical protein